VTSMGIESTQHEGPAQGVAIVLGFLSGAAVFAAAHDFVIGVGLGAAGYALAARVTRMWTSRSGDQTAADRPHDRDSVR
jgi:hypothetical protein